MSSKWLAPACLSRWSAAWAHAFVTALDGQAADPDLLKVLTALVLAATAVAGVGMIMSALSLRHHPLANETDIFGRGPRPETDIVP